MRSFVVLCLFGLFAGCYGAKICAFNIQSFGPTKAGKPDVMNNICQVMSLFDLIIVQEVRDSSGGAQAQLLSDLNAYVGFTEYDYYCGVRLGRSSYTEQYCFYFKSAMFSIIDAYEYPDPGDIFERQPTVVHFQHKTSTSSLTEFAIAALHAKPDDAVVELDASVDVYDYIAQTSTEIVLMWRWRIGPIFVLTPILVSSGPFLCWQDTTVSGNTHCAYDRFVLAGADLIANSDDYGEVFYSDYALGWTYAATSDVSDHYPVYMNVN
ncbi:putative deoxyribonuclease-1 [Apostichopus japonicus]|uniref:Putative deoxyribonuclease-1 n=1 Tax=Stichopus japonicus TaxID=307972 RepID=A0A2G8KE20_STIJA|nr:putative deoxyribonuclease-1 [Apostichopus japonicus]